MSPLEQRILEISYKKKLSHIGSCLSTLPILEEIYKHRASNEPVILSNGHAGLALYVVLEKESEFYAHMGELGEVKCTEVNAEELFDLHGVHPNRDLAHGIYCSTGSLGLGITIACGMAFADRTKNVYCVCSDGEAAEGAFWEVLRIKDIYKLTNLKIYVNANGWGAYDAVDRELLSKRIHAFSPDVKVVYTSSDRKDILVGLDAHYKALTQEEYSKLLCP